MNETGSQGGGAEGGLGDRGMRTWDGVGSREVEVEADEVSGFRMAGRWGSWRRGEKEGYCGG